MAGGELLLPMARRFVVVGASLPPRATHREIEELSYSLGGRAARPREPVVLVGADGVTPIIVYGGGDAEASELQDTAHEALRRSEENVAKTGSSIDYELQREQMGLPRKEDVPRLMHDAIAERVKRHKQNPITDPPRDPWKEWREHPLYEEFTNGS